LNKPEDILNGLTNTNVWSKKVWTKRCKKDWQPKARLQKGLTLTKLFRQESNCRTWEWAS